MRTIRHTQAKTVPSTIHFATIRASAQLQRKFIGRRMTESRCCPFFDFHIDLENQGKLICLRLTGEEGIKAFIRAEFAVK